MRRAARMLALAAATLAVAACGPRITAPRVGAAVAAAFPRLFVLQQSLSGREVAPPVVTVTCARPGGGSGAGSDWSCAVQYVADSGPGAVTYEVEVRTNGCYTATASGGAVGPARLVTPSGERRVNPLAAFDGCFPT